MKRILVLLISVFVLSCNQTRNNDQEGPLDFLVGNWKRLNEEAGKETFENWVKIGPSEYSGIGFTLEKGDTISQEKMDFIETDGQWTLLVKMPDEPGPTQFEMAELKAKEFTCTNDSIEFPKGIHYWMEGDTMKAKIYSDEMEIPFVFGKVD
jgi:hypothetical protein